MNRSASTLDRMANAGPLWDPDFGNEANGRSAMAGNASERSQRVLGTMLAADRQRSEVAQQLGEFRTTTGGYSFDFFALRTGEAYGGLPVYDLGMLVGER